MLAVFLFMLGALVASFAGVVTCRLETGEPFMRGRSRCDRCGRLLPPRALVPILSYLVQRGRARCCGARIPPSAPVGELLLGTLFVLAYSALGLSFELILFLLALTLLAILVLYDLAHHILPPVPLALFCAVAALLALVTHAPLGASMQVFLMAFALSAFILALHYGSLGRAMGFADAPLTFGLALLTAPHALTGLFFSFWIGAILGIMILLDRPRGHRIGIEVPFAPYLAAGFLLAYFTKWNILALIGF